MTTNSESQPDPSVRVRRLRRQRARLRREIGRLRADLAQAGAELDRLRAVTLEVFPDVVLDDRVGTVVGGVRDERLTYLTEDQLRSLVSCVAEAEAAGRPGLVIEAGAALGGSAIALAAAKSPDRPMRVYDVFGMIPPPNEKDGADVLRRYLDISEGRSQGLGGDTYYGYHDDLLSEVTASFARHGVPVEDNRVELVRGLFEETLEIDEPVALAHVDGDWYESTKTCLERIAPHLARAAGSSSTTTGTGPAAGGPSTNTSPPIRACAPRCAPRCTWSAPDHDLARSGGRRSEAGDRDARPHLVRLVDRDQHRGEWLELTRQP